MSAPKETAAAPAAPAPPPLAAPNKRVRDQVREHLIPANTILGLSFALVSLADMMLPAVLPWVVGLRNVALVVVAALIFSAFRPGPLDALLLRLGMKPAGQPEAPTVLWRSRSWRALVLASAGAVVALSATLSKADTGGVVASRFPRVRSLQEQLFGLQQQVARVQQGVDQTQRTLEAMNARERARDEQAAASPASVAMLDLQAAGPADRAGAPWPVRLAVYANATGIDFSRARLLLAHGTADGKPRVQALTATLATLLGTAPGAAQLMLTIPADTRWLSACLLLPEGRDASRRALVARWRAEPAAEGLRVSPDGAPTWQAAGDPACAE